MGKKFAIYVATPVLIFILVVAIASSVLEILVNKVSDAVRGKSTSTSSSVSNPSADSPSVIQDNQEQSNEGESAISIDYANRKLVLNQSVIDNVNKLVDDMGDFSSKGFGETNEYISKFLEAEASTLYPDMRDYDAISKNKPIEDGNLQGAVRFKRTTNGKSDFITYMPQGQFNSCIAANATDAQKNNAIQHFTIDEKSGDIVIANWSKYSKLVEDTRSENPQSDASYTITTKNISLSTILQEYAMPFEFPLMLTTISGNPEFGKAVAQLAIDSDIIITINDNTVNTEVITTENYSGYKKQLLKYGGIAKQELNIPTSIPNMEVATTVIDDPYNIYSGAIYQLTSMSVKMDRFIERKSDYQYQIKTTLKTEDNTLSIELTSVKSWIADIEKSYTYSSSDTGVVQTNHIEAIQDEKKIAEKTYTNVYVPDGDIKTEAVSNIDAQLTTRLIDGKDRFNQDIKIPIKYNITLNNYDEEYYEKNDCITTETTQVRKTICTEGPMTKSSRESYFLGLIKNSTGKYESLFNADGSVNPNSEYNAKGKKVKYQSSNGGYTEAPYDNLVISQERLYTMLSKNSYTKDLENPMRYFIYVLTGKDTGVTSLDLNSFGNTTSFVETGISGGISTFLEWLHAWEGCGSKSPDGKYYIVGDDGAGNPTVGYGIDIYNSGFLDRFIAGGYDVSMGAKIPVDFVDSLEKEEVQSCISSIEAKTAGLNLKEYQKYALVSRAYNCGMAGAVRERNGKTFVEAFRAYWNDSDNAYGKPVTDSIYQNKLYSQYMNQPTSSRGKVLTGLIERRKAEWKLFTTGYYDRISTYWKESSGGAIIQKAEELHKYLRTNGYTYAQAGINIPVKGGKTIDCSSYVSWVLYECGFKQFGGYQKTSSTFIQNPWGWQEVSLSQAQAGDILCYNGHVEIYAGSLNGSKALVYNCGGNTSINAAETSNSGHSTSEIVKIIRVPQ